MKPNFALSLSFEGIRLLHRAAGGWRVVGDVALDAPDMAAELAVLRRTATALDPSGLRTKVLLPNAQIKYLSIDTEGMDDAERRAAARLALDGATPYAVEDLAFDISTDGPRTHVAAVARETLTEAEDFADEHRFNPISFAAVPDDTPYLGEPFFGPAPKALAALADGETIEPDGIAVVIIGTAEPTEGPVAADEGSEPEPEDASPTADPEEPSAQEDQPRETPAAETASDAHEDKEAPAPVDLSTDDPAPADMDDLELPADADKAADAKTDASPTPPQNDQPEEVPVAAEPQQVEASDGPPETPPAPTAAPVNSDAPKADPKPAPPVPEPAAFKSSDIIDDVPPMPAFTRPVLGSPTDAKDSAAAGPASAGFASRRTEPKMATGGRIEPSVTRAASPPPPAAPAAPVASPVVPAAPAVAADTAAPAPAQTTTSEGPSKAATGIAAAAAAAAPIGRFLSRRRSGAAAPQTAAAAQPAAAAAVTPPQTEAERMTIFGARQSNVGGKPRFLGLILTAALLVFLAGVAAWASVFLDDGLNLSRLFGDRTTREAENTTTAPEQTPAAHQPEAVVTAALNTSLTPEDTAVLDALREPVAPTQPEGMTQREVEAYYATTGIWPRAPQVPPAPSGLVNIDDMYLTSIDPVSSAVDAVALPAVASFGTDLPLGSTASPAAAGTRFALDARGLVVPTAAGAISPNGFTVYQGSPPAKPPATLARFAAVPQDDPARTALAALRPKTRPGDLAETNERATLNGLTRRELAGERPKLRPRSVQQQAQAAEQKALAEAKAAEEAKKAAEAAVNTDAAVEAALATEAAPKVFENATRLATKASARPDTRPRNFARIVRRAQRTEQPKATETRVASRQVAPRVVTPRNPTKTSVARQATVKNAINLRKVNLIGVYGKPSNRRALVRLGNGRYKKVTVGDRIDGGRVQAISNSELRYSKGGRNVTLRMP